MSDTTEGKSQKKRPSGRFVLRIDPGLHAFLRESADAAAMSLNEFCARSLVLPPTGLPEEILAGLGKAIRLWGNDILGAVGFGSWARDEMVEGSDVDLLLVLKSDLKINRSLYRAWDRCPLAGLDHAVEPHLVHLPDEGARITGLWAEVVVDGIMLFDKDLSLSRRMAEIRRRIVSGELIRRWSGGHPYWTEVA